MLTIEYVKNPIWNDADHVTVLLTVKFMEFAEEVPFTATPYDDVAHGKLLYQNAIAGQYGNIAEYIPPTPVTEQNLPVTTI